MTVHLAGAPGSKYAIKMVGNNTVSVLGKIAVTGTAGRLNPPQPFNGFKTDYTPFGNGHVFALSLGGTDETKNLVPQWEQWQQTGAWRIVETTCEQFRGQIFRCDITYNSGLMNQYNHLHAKFNNGERLIAWSGPDLPISFEVSVHSVTMDLSTILSESDYDAALAQLTVQNQSFRSPVFDVTAMPNEDRQYWVKDVGKDVAKTVHGDFVEEEKRQAEANGLVFERAASLSTFTMFQNSMDEIRQNLSKVPGILPTEAGGFQATALFDKDTDKKMKMRQAEFKKRQLGGLASRRDATITRQKNDREKRLALRRGI